MRRLFSPQFIVCCVLLALLATPAFAQQVAGTWFLEVELDVGQGGAATFVLTLEDGEISGTYTGALGDDVAVSGRVTEDGLRFSFDSQAGEVVYDGKIDGDTMEGICEYGQLGSGTFKGERQQ